MSFILPRCFISVLILRRYQRPICKSNEDLLFGDKCVQKCKSNFTRVPGSEACECVGNFDLLFGGELHFPLERSCLIASLALADQCHPKCKATEERIPGSANCVSFPYCRDVTFSHVCYSVPSAARTSLFCLATCAPIIAQKARREFQALLTAVRFPFDTAALCLICSSSSR